MSESKESNKKSELLTKLDELLGTVGDKYGPFMIQELYNRMEKTVQDFNLELDNLFEESFDNTKKINNAVNDAIASGQDPDMSGIRKNINQNVPNFISKKNEKKDSKLESKNKTKEKKKKRGFFSRKKK